jgi:hypothetical protein
VQSIQLLIPLETESTRESVGLRTGNILGGFLDGSLKALHDGVDKSAKAIRDGAGFGGSILRLDFAGALGEVGNLFFDAVDLYALWLRWNFGGYIERYSKPRFRGSLTHSGTSEKILRHAATGN